MLIFAILNTRYSGVGRITTDKYTFKIGSAAYFCSTAENIDIAFLIWEIVKILFAIALFFFQRWKGRNGNRQNRRNNAFLRRMEAQELEEIDLD